MTKSNPSNEIESRFNRLNESEQMDEDAMSLEEAYDTLLEDYQEARKLNDELEEMIHEYIQVYGAL